MLTFINFKNYFRTINIIQNLSINFIKRLSNIGTEYFSYTKKLSDKEHIMFSIF